MRIAVLCGHYPYSGAGVIAFEAARELARAHEVAFIHGGSEELDLREEGLRRISLPLPPEPDRRPWHLFWNPAMIRKLKAALRSFQPEILHFHIVQRRSFSLAALLLSRRAPTVWTLHDQWHLCLRSVPEPPSCEGMRRLCVFCSAWPGASIAGKLLKEAVYAASPLEVVVPSRWLEELTRYSLLGRKKMHLVYNGIDLERFQPASEEAGDRAVTLLFVSGPNDPTKGLAELLQAFQALRAAHPKVKLRLVGTLPPGAPAEGIEATGSVERERMPEEYRRADLFVLPTLADNTPVTLMEAMASGLPSVATRVGGIPELVRDDVTGRLVAPGDVAGLTSALDDLVRDGAQRRAMGRAARREAEARFSRRRMAGQLEGIYRGMLGRIEMRAAGAEASAAGGAS
ncbi:MAG TPA: glycosyltransferase family 4 protein [Candidatus Polarisedimenticolia bacterium]|nr:glycosyltransferase family 4 protein [Candidatus Polarisedimenticolia bacterium]